MCVESECENSVARHEVADHLEMLAQELRAGKASVRYHVRAKTNGRPDPECQVGIQIARQAGGTVDIQEEL